MRTVYHGQLRGVVQATRFRGPERFEWYGISQADAGSAPGLDPEQRRRALHSGLRECLYRHFYCQGGATLPTPDVPVSTPAEKRRFAAGLARANSGTGYWAAGWRLMGETDAQSTVEGAGLRTVAPRDRVRPDRTSDLPDDRTVELRMPSGSDSLLPGFYVAFGNAITPGAFAAGMVRIYVNLRPAIGAEAVSLFSEALNAADLPFKFKVLSDPALYARCDPAVLYVCRADLAAALDLVERVHPRLRAGLRSPVPALTKRVAPGISLAEDPGHGASFGLHRCGLLAEGLIHAAATGIEGEEQRTRVLCEYLERGGVRIEAPYLNADSPDFPAGLRLGTDETTTESRPRGVAHPVDPLGCADRIGALLEDMAVWHGERCNWVTLRKAPTPGSAGPSRSFRALGPDMYAGSAGVAHFLTALAVRNGRSSTMHTARGALLSAVDMVEHRRTGSGQGLYLGPAGVAVLAAAAGMTLGDQDLVQRVRRLVLDPGWDPGASGHDLLGGTAGLLLAYVALARLLGAEELLQRALAQLDGLEASAEREPVGASWASASAARRNLTGLSHGTAGVAYALLRLFEATREPRALALADHALDYERSCFDEVARNWPDFREVAFERDPNSKAEAFACFWCHGAPGIALSRCLAYRVTGDARYAREADLALETTRAGVRASLESGVGGYAACHGLAGNAEVLYLTTDDSETTSQALIEEVAAEGWSRYGRFDGAWPTGIGPTRDPGFMTGMSGIGHFYLQLHDPTVPSLLMIDPARLAGTAPASRPTLPPSPLERLL